MHCWAKDTPPAKVHLGFDPSRLCKAPREMTSLTSPACSSTPCFCLCLTSAVVTTVIVGVPHTTLLDQTQMHSHACTAQPSAAWLMERLR